ncbi:hypothetical protein DOY81_007904, partial [Sarcophaga bullata]
APHFLGPLITCALLFIAVEANSSQYAKLCRLFKQGTKVRIPGKCDEYMVCYGTTAQFFKCGNNFKYDAETENCTDKLDTTQLCDNRCQGAEDGRWVADPTNCGGYYYCLNGQGKHGHCGNGFHYSEAEQKCIYTKNSACVDVNNICELVPNNTTFLDEKDCSKYYECKNNQQTWTPCPKETYFSKEEGKCLEKMYVKCNAHPKVSCKDNGVVYKGLKSDGATCRGYFKCADKGLVEDIDPLWYQCPEGKFYSDQKCVHPVDAVCNYNRCEGRGTTVVNSGKNNCRNYLVCENDVVVKEVTCGNDFFFDEITQTCSQKVIYYKCCDDPLSYTNRTLIN